LEQIGTALDEEIIEPVFWRTAYRERRIEMIDHLSASQLNMFLRCPMQYRFRYIEGLRRPPLGKWIQGGAVHEALAHNYEQKIKSHEDLKCSDVVGFMAAAFEARVKKEGEVDWEETLPGDLLDQGLLVTQKYQKVWAPSVQPIAVELEQRIQFGEGFPDLLGYIDLINDSGLIIDHKVVARRTPQGDANNAVQLSCYGMMRSVATGVEDQELAFDCLVKTKTPKVVRVNTMRKPPDHAFLLKQMGEIYRCIMAGVFVPNTNGWHCSPKYCGYYGMCRGKK